MELIAEQFNDGYILRRLIVTLVQCFSGGEILDNKPHWSINVSMNLVVSSLTRASDIP